MDSHKTLGNYTLKIFLFAKHSSLFCDDIGGETVNVCDLKILQLKAGLHYGDYRSKLVHFKAQKYLLYLKPLAQSDFRHGVNTTSLNYISIGKVN